MSIEREDPEQNHADKVPHSAACVLIYDALKRARQGVTQLLFPEPLTDKDYQRISDHYMRRAGFDVDRQNLIEDGDRGQLAIEDNREAGQLTVGEDEKEGEE